MAKHVARTEWTKEDKQKAAFDRILRANAWRLNQRLALLRLPVFGEWII